MNLLTEREWQVIWFRGQGFQTKQVASILNISIRTVDDHIRNIYKKTKSENLQQAVCSINKETRSWRSARR